MPQMNNAAPVTKCCEFGMHLGQVHFIVEKMWPSYFHVSGQLYLDEALVCKRQVDINNVVHPPK